MYVHDDDHTAAAHFVFGLIYLFHINSAKEKVNDEEDGNKTEEKEEEEEEEANKRSSSGSSASLSAAGLSATALIKNPTLSDEVMIGFESWLESEPSDEREEGGPRKGPDR